ncbi:MAG: sugar phosphate isomerase/epimerase family protein [Chloroflexota bacterium]
MHFGAHIFLWTGRWTNACLPLMDRVRGLGLDLLEIACGDDIEFDPSAVRRRAGSLGLSLALSPGGSWPMEADIAHADPAVRRKGLAWHRRWIERAGEAGVIAYTGALYAHPGRVERRGPDADEHRRAAEGLHALAAIGAACGVAVVIEPMSHFRTHLVNTPDQAMRLLDAADHPNLGVLFDTYHAVTEVRDYAAAVHTLAPRLWGLHACESDRGVPGGGLVPWDALFAALSAVRFDGCVLFETYNSTLDAGRFAYARSMFHQVCPDGDAFVRAGLEFMHAFLVPAADASLVKPARQAAAFRSPSP